MTPVEILTLLFRQNSCGGCEGGAGGVEHTLKNPLTGRSWKFDFCWVAEKTVVEFEGGVYQRGSHMHLDRYVSDCRKYTRAALEGWTVLRYTAADMPDAKRILAEVKRALGR